MGFTQYPDWLCYYLYGQPQNPGYTENYHTLRCEKMNPIILIVFLIGVYLASSLNESMQERKDANQDKDISKQIGAIDMGHYLQSIEHHSNTTGNGDTLTEASQSKSNSTQSLLYENIGARDNNGPPLLDNNFTQYEEDEINEASVENKDEDDIWINTKASEDILETLQSENNNRQSKIGFPSGELSEQHESFLTNANILGIESYENNNKTYINMLEDEDIKYVLNQEYDTSDESVKNETHNVVYYKKTNHDHAITSQSEIHINEHEDDGDSRKSKSQNLIHEENNANLRVPASNNAVSHDERSQGQVKHQQLNENISNGGFSKVREDVAQVVYTGEITDNDQKEKNIYNASSTLNTLRNPTTLLNSSDLHESQDWETDMEEVHHSNSDTNTSSDPCKDFSCKRGMTCKIDGERNPFCACQDKDNCLPVNINDRVCGTDNKTYNSACHLFATKCQLQGTKEGNHLHLDYQGPCKYIPPCTKYELVHFPFRMRDWLKNVLIQLYERGPENSDLLSEKQRNKVKKIYENEKRLHVGDHNIDLLVKDFQKNYHMFVYPIHWQFHQLDQHLLDRLLTRSELAPLRAPLMPMEHCVTAFLQKCNTNNDRQISLREWCICFGIKEGDIDENLLF